MGLLGLFKGRGKEEPRATEMPPAEVKLSGISEWLSQELSENIQSARKRSGELQEGIVGGFSQVGDSARRLERMEFEARDKTYAAVNSVKDTFAKRTRSISGKCPGPEPDSYSGMREFHRRADLLLKELMNISPRQGMILSSYFRKESSSVMKNIKGINSGLEELQRFLDYEGRPLFLMEEAGRASQEISGRLESLGNLEKREREIEGEIRRLKEDLSGREEELDAISRNPGWKDLEKAKGEREELEGRARDLKFRIGEELSSAKRPLKKYLHLKAGELPREERDFLERFVKSPLKIVMSGRMEQLRSHLLILRGMPGAEINLKDKETKKLDELIERMESGETARMMGEYSGLLDRAGERERETEEGLSGLSEEKKQAEIGIREAKNDIGKLERELGELKEKAKALKEEADREMAKLENLIYENINRKVNIDLDIAH